MLNKDYLLMKIYIHIQINDLIYSIEKTFQKNIIEIVSFRSILNMFHASFSYGAKQKFAEKELFTELVEM